MHRRRTAARAIALVAAATGWLAAGCPGPPRSSPARPPARPTAAEAAAPSPAGPPGAPAATEAQARRELARRFRRAGYRILFDVPLHLPGGDLVADGFDPQRRVGFEYVAPSERALELDRTARAALARQTSLHLLVIDAGPPDRWLPLVNRFLARLALSQRGRSESGR